MKKVGIYKSRHWNFQSEWRFVLKILPNSSLSPINKDKNELDLVSNIIFSIKEGNKIPFNNYLVDIDESRFKDMEILLGPKHTKADKIIVESLVNKYNPNAKIAVSELYEKIR
ncbi:MAG: hypothetical protein GQ564_20860 [Bacteroidales bacterium]|nr:hypothetical protein [Bacteroidales bacterium]